MTTTPLDLDALDAAEKVILRDWVTHYDGVVYYKTERGERPVFPSRDEAAFITALRNAAPALIAMARNGQRTGAEWLKASGLVHEGLNAQLESTEADLFRANAEIACLREALEAAEEFLSGDLDNRFRSSDGVWEPRSAAPKDECDALAKIRAALGKGETKNV